MPRRKRFTAERIIGRFREAEVQLARGKTLSDVVRKLGVVSRELTSEDVLERLSGLFERRGVLDHIRSDDGGEFTAMRAREWRARATEDPVPIGVLDEVCAEGAASCGLRSPSATALA